MRYRLLSILALGFVVLAMLGSCRHFEEMLEDDYGLRIYNATGDTICIYEATGYYVYTPTTYPDTFLPPNNVCWKGETVSDFIIRHQIFPYSVGYTYPILTKNYKPIVSLPKDTLSIFFINKDTLCKYGYDMVRDSNLIIARYELSMDEIKKLYKESKSIVFPKE